MANVATMIQPKQHRPAKMNIYDLHQAIKSQQDTMVEYILEETKQHKVDLNATVYGCTALSLSLYKQTKNIFDLLVHHHNQIDLNKISRDDRNRLEPPLVTATRLCDTQSVERLLLLGAQIDSTDSFNHTALWTATRQRHIGILKRLIHSGASVSPSEQLSCSPFYLCMRYGHKRKELAQCLIYNGAFINMKSDISFLHQTLCSNNSSIIELLIEAGYNVSADKGFIEGLRKDEYVLSEELRNILEDELSTPQPLLRQCRSKIRHLVSEKNNGQFFMKHISTLPIPSTMQSYLTIYKTIEYNCPL